MRGDEGKKASVKWDEIVIYWERMLPTLLVIITHLFVVSSRQRSYGWPSVRKEIVGRSQNGLQRTIPQYTEATEKQFQ